MWDVGEEKYAFQKRMPQSWGKYCKVHQKTDKLLQELKELNSQVILLVHAVQLHPAPHTPLPSLKGNETTLVTAILCLPYKT